MAKAENVVSVIIPVYNVYLYVREAIDSVIHQTYPYLEIIIIDDGSSDGSGEICDEYAEKDERIKTIHTENRGLSAARNTGLKIATGEYITFLDSDDAIIPDAIEKALQVIRNKDADAVSYGFISLRTKGPLEEANREEVTCYECIPPTGQFSSEQALRLLLSSSRICVAVWCMLSKASLWKGVSFPEGFVYEDNYVTPEIIKKARRICSLSEAFILNRRRKGSITQTYTEKNMRDQLRAHRFLTEFVKEKMPDMYDDSFITRMKEKEIRIMIKQYSISRESLYRKELRRNILAVAKEIKHKKVRAVTRIKVFGMLCAPRTISTLLYYMIYRYNIET